MIRTSLTRATLLVVLALLLCSTPQQFLLDGVNADATPSQGGKMQVSTEDVAGLHRVIITTPQGNKIFVNLPDDMAEGDTISGTVFAEAAGNPNTERATNLLELKDQSVEILGQTVPATGGRFKADLPLGACCLPDPNPKNPCAQIPRSPRPPYGLLIPKECLVFGPPRLIDRRRTPFKFHYDLPPYDLPPFGQAGRFVEIRGPFNGAIARTDYVRIGGLEMKLLAESPRKTVFFNTSTVIGPTEIEVKEQEQVHKGPFRNLSLDLSALKYDLHRGERTKLQIVVKGLDNLQEEIPLRLENRSTNILTIDGGNMQTLTIRPKDVKPGGIYETQRTLTGIQVGAFFIEGIVTWDRR